MSVVGRLILYQMLYVLVNYCSLLRIVKNAGVLGHVYNRKTFK